MLEIFHPGDFDIALMVFDVFVLFFIGLVLYLRREDRREGYPLEDDVHGRLEPAGGLLFSAKPKTFTLAHGGTVTKPDGKRDDRELAAKRTSPAPGSPLEPTGDPMMAGVGPGSFATRAKTPDMLVGHGPKITPLRIAEGFSIDPKDPDPRGMKVIGADGVVAGEVSDVWIDRGEVLIRYIEVKLPDGRPVLAPMPLCKVKKSTRTIEVGAILGGQFAKVPALASPDQITFDEEERVAAFFGAGLLYATSRRAEPLL